MTPIDHGLSVGLLGLGLQPLFRRYLSKPKTAVLMIIAGMLPDIDYVTRLMGKKYYYNTVNNLFLSHRGFTHSLGGIFFFAFLILSFYALFVSFPPYREGRRVIMKFPLIFSLVLLAGALHLFEDFLGPNGPWKGLVLLYPFSETRYPGVSLYGWYDFYTIYLFTAAFAVVALLNVTLWLFRVRSLWTNLLTVSLVAGTFFIAGHHVLTSPGYPERQGFKKAEAIWKTYQLSILPAAVKEFSNQAQDSGMKTLFASLPGMKMEDYFKAAVWLIGGVLALLCIHMVVYLITLRWRETLPRGSPIKNFIFAAFFLVILPLGGLGIYYFGKTPLRMNPEEVPMATGFDYPVGDENGKGWNGVDDKGWYIASGFLKPYFHPGEDWNGRGGGDTDFGQPVYAVAEGRVAFAQDCFRWGNMLLIQHRLPDGEVVFSLYAHLKDIQVKPGELIARRQRVGSLGKGHKNVYTAAHLHFEIRRQNMAGYPIIFWPRALTALLCAHKPFSEKPTKEWIISHYYNPSKFIRNRRNLIKQWPKKLCTSPNERSKKTASYDNLAQDWIEFGFL
jgi:murein DD-endopeptidase MepM/ murein hydrolase activator NlpD/membrane-bound metal-dependent hydrolase YbcI (DUF457 family)